ERLALRFDLLALDRLTAEVELRRENYDLILLEATFAAEFEQSCALTLEPVRGALSDRFTLLNGPAENQSQELALNGEEPAFEPLSGDSIDIGEAVAQELSLVLPEFPRLADVAIDDLAGAEPLEGPFAVLARFGAREEC